MGHGPIRTRPWKRPPWRRKRRGPGEFNVISEPTAAAMAATSPFRDGSCLQQVDVPGGLDCNMTIPMNPVVLSSAAEGDLAGQPLWPKHTVESVRGEIFFFTIGQLVNGSIKTPGQGVMVHMGIRKTRFDYDAVSPSFETDFDPAHEDDAEARWIWTKHLYIPPALFSTNSGALLGDGSGAAWQITDSVPHNRAHVTVNERNRVKLEENEGLVLVTTFSCDPWLYLGASLAPLGEIHTHGVTVGMTSYLRTYVRQSR